MKPSQTPTPFLGRAKALNSNFPLLAMAFRHVTLPLQVPFPLLRSGMTCLIFLIGWIHTYSIIIRLLPKSFPTVSSLGEVSGSLPKLGPMSRTTGKPDKHAVISSDDAAARATPTQETSHI